MIYNNVKIKQLIGMITQADGSTTNPTVTVYYSTFKYNPTMDRLATGRYQFNGLFNGELSEGQIVHLGHANGLPQINIPIGLDIAKYLASWAAPNLLTTVKASDATYEDMYTIGSWLAIPIQLITIQKT